jgi:hypothetical protein
MEVAKFPTAAPFGCLILALPPAPAHALPPLRYHVNKIEALSLSVIVAILLPTMLTSCGKKTQGGKEKTAQKSEDDFLDKDAKPDERKYLLAAKPFFIAVANRKYAEAYALLSSHARARMALNQFTPAQQDADFQRNEAYPYANVTAELSPQELEKVAKTQGITVEELKKEEDFDPYFNLKVVLVEEGGQLKVGYFEFLPPSMMD